MFNNLRELITSMPTEKQCREYLAANRWPDGRIICPYCRNPKSYVIEGGERYKCANNKCYKRFTVTVGTVLEASNIPVSKWLMAVYLVTGHKKGISSHQLGRDLGITQSNAWFLMHRIREVLKPNDNELLSGVVEIDETYLAKKYRSPYKGLPPEEVDRLREEYKGVNKGAAIGIVQRNGKAIIRAIDSINKANVKEIVNQYVSKENTVLMTDESSVYSWALSGYKREYVTHSKGQWKDGNCHTNTVEGLWAVMKRGLYGIYHNVTPKHLQSYCNEFAFRYNSRGIKDSQRFILSLSNIEGRLTYKTLISEKAPKEKDTRSDYYKNKAQRRPTA